jgi:hypothetical protein
MRILPWIIVLTGVGFLLAGSAARPFSRYGPLIIWLEMAGFLLTQVICGVVLDGAWRPWYRRNKDAVGFWTVITIQTVGLLAVGTIGAVISLSSR